MPALFILPHIAMLYILYTVNSCEQLFDICLYYVYIIIVDGQYSSSVGLKNKHFHLSVQCQYHGWSDIALLNSNNVVIIEFKSSDSALFSRMLLPSCNLALTSSIHIFVPVW